MSKNLVCDGCNHNYINPHEQIRVKSDNLGRLDFCAASCLAQYLAREESLGIWAYVDRISGQIISGDDCPEEAHFTIEVKPNEKLDQAFRGDNEKPTWGGVLMGGKLIQDRLDKP
jgi:hypothetical protein